MGRRTRERPCLQGSVKDRKVDTMPAGGEAMSDPTYPEFVAALVRKTAERLGIPEDELTRPWPEPSPVLAALVAGDPVVIDGLLYNRGAEPIPVVLRDGMVFAAEPDDGLTATP